MQDIIKNVNHENEQESVSTPRTQSHTPKLTSDVPSLAARKAAWFTDSKSPEFRGEFGSRWLRHLDGDLSTHLHLLNACVDPSPFVADDSPDEWRHFSYTQTEAFRADFVDVALAARRGDIDLDPVAQCVLFCPQYVQPVADDACNTTKTFINEISRTWAHLGELEAYEVTDKKHAYSYAVPRKVVLEVRSYLSPTGAKWLAQAWQIITYSDNPDNANDARATRYKWYDEVANRYVDVTEDDIMQIIPRLRPGITSRPALRATATLILSYARVVTQVRDGGRIVCGGGTQVLTLAKYGSDEFVSEPDPDEIAVNVLPYRYDPSVTSEDGERLMDALSNHDPQIRDTMYEVMGTCMSSGCTPLVFLVGDLLSGTGRDKANGKSTFIDLVRIVVGSANSTEFKIRDYSGEFTKVVLRDKLVATDSDMSSDLIDSDTISELKVTSGGRDMVFTNVKHEKPIMFPASHTQLTASNTLPVLSTKDLATGALDRRWNFIPFINYFGRLPNGEMSPERDQALVDRVLGSVDGAIPPDEDAMTYIFTRAIDGLARYIAQGKEFTDSDYSRRVRLELQLSNNSIINYVYSSDTPFKRDMFCGLVTNPEVNEACIDGEYSKSGARKFMIEVKPGIGIRQGHEDQDLVCYGTSRSISAHYSAYKQFCDVNGLYKVARKFFKKAMHSLFGLNETVAKIYDPTIGRSRSVRVFVSDPAYKSYAEGLGYLRGDDTFEPLVPATDAVPDPDLDPDGGPGGGVDAPMTEDEVVDAMEIERHDVSVNDSDICGTDCNDGDVKCHVVAPYLVLAHLEAAYRREHNGKSLRGDRGAGSKMIGAVVSAAKGYLKQLSSDSYQIGEHELDRRFVEHLAEAAGLMCAEDKHALDAMPKSLVSTYGQAGHILEMMVKASVENARALADDARAELARPSDDTDSRKRDAYRQLICDVLRFEIAWFEMILDLHDLRPWLESFHHVSDYVRNNSHYGLDDGAMGRLEWACRYSVARKHREMGRDRDAEVAVSGNEVVDLDTVSIDEVLGDSDVDDADGDRNADVEAGSE